MRADPLYPLVLVLILLGAFTKSAQFPFHFWLPHAMAAPTPVSAYLHSATMVKAGVFLLARLYPTLGGSDLWFYAVSGTGLVTMTFGAAVAIFQQDLKGLLAYSTISHLGLITFLFGLDSQLAVVAGLFHILNHAVFKASLFMAAGIIDHETGSRDMRQLNGLWQFMPITGTLAMVAAGAMAGVPLLNGFLSKEMFFSETVDLDAHQLVEMDGARSSPRCRGARGELQHALHPRRVLQRRTGRAHEDAARAAALAARAGGIPGRRVPGGGHRPQLDRRDPCSRSMVKGTLGDAAARTASRSGTASTLPLLMSAIALAAGVVVLFRPAADDQPAFGHAPAGVGKARVRRRRRRRSRRLDGRVVGWLPTTSLPRHLAWIVVDGDRGDGVAAVAVRIRRRAAAAAVGRATRRR